MSPNSNGQGQRTVVFDADQRTSKVATDIWREIAGQGNGHEQRTQRTAKATDTTGVVITTRRSVQAH